MQQASSSLWLKILMYVTLVGVAPLLAALLFKFSLTTVAQPETETSIGLIALVSCVFYVCGLVFALCMSAEHEFKKLVENLCNSMSLSKKQ